MDIELLKHHLNIEHDEDNALLEFLYKAVLGMAEGYLGVALSEDDIEESMLVTEQIRAAIFIAVSHIYNNRGDDQKDTTTVSKHELPSAFHYLLLNKRLF